MDIADRKMAMRVAATHGTKQAVELAMSVAALAERLGVDPAFLCELEANSARRHIRAIRRELDDLEQLIAGQEPKVEAAPRAA